MELLINAPSATTDSERSQNERLWNRINNRIGSNWNGVVFRGGCYCHTNIDKISIDLVFTNSYNKCGYQQGGRE